MTVEDYAQRVAANKSDLESHAFKVGQIKYLVGNGYDKGYRNVESYAAQHAREKKQLKREEAVVSRLHTQAVSLESKLDRPLTLPSIPTEAVSTAFNNPIQTANLDSYVIPDFSGLTRQEIDEIAKGKPSPYLNVFPREYFAGMARGKYPLPTEGAYLVYADKAVRNETPVTELSERSGIQNLAHAPITQVREILYRKGSGVVEELGFSRGHTVKPLSTREAAIIASHTAMDKLITNTREHGSRTHLVFDGKSVVPRDGNKNGVPTRLGVVTRKRQPERYLNTSAASR